MPKHVDNDRLTDLLPGPRPQSIRTAPMAKGTVLQWDTVQRQVTVTVTVTDCVSGAPVNAAVSDGETVRRFRGEPVTFTLTVEKGDLRFVHVCVPAGYEPVSRWFRLVTPDEATEHYTVEFRLRPNPATAQERFRFLVTADSQGSGDTWRTELTAAFHEMATIEGGPLFLVNCGDLTMTGWVEEWLDYAEARQQGPARSYELFGGHGGNYALDLNNGESRLGGTGHFGLFCGPAYYAWDCGRFHCIAINAVINHYEPASLCDRQGRWIAEDLKVACDGRPVLLFSHHDTGSLRNDLGITVPGALYCFYGHWHWNGVGRDNGVWQIQTAPLRGEDWGRMSACVRVCDVDGETITDELRPLGEQ